MAQKKTVSGLARDLEISESLLRNYMSGKVLPGLEKATKIADRAQISLDWLAGRPGAPREYGDQSTLDSVQAGITEATGLVPVPVYTSVEAGAGRTKVVEDESEKTWLWISSVWVERYGKSNLAIIKATGDSMLPAIEPGTLILLNLADKSRSSGVRVVRLEDGLTVKRCDPQPRKALRMVSDNSAYEPFTAKAGEYEIIGSVVATIKVWE